jgi:predicted secreted hydrolase
VRARLVWALLGSALCACGRAPDPGEIGGTASSTGIRFLGGPEVAGFARATAPRTFEFPADHGEHPDFRTEWWYFTGNLRDAAEQPYGFELTFFRIALAANELERESRWASRQTWMAHFAVTDPAGRRFFTAQRLARGALGLAGASADPFRVWVKDWSAAGTAEPERMSFRLTAKEGPTAIDLELSTSDPPVPHGDRGLDAKGPEPGNASFYYSIPRVEAEGSLTLDGRERRVSGLVWMDREWSTSALSEGVAGWDWFALRLSDGRSLMFYRLRQRDGRATSFSGGTLVAADGSGRRLGATEVELEAVDSWVSPRTGVRYPVRWRLRVPSAGVALELEPLVDDQEVDLSVRYWEGAVRASGRAGDQPLQAEGYVELAGY